VLLKESLANNACQTLLAVIFLLVNIACQGINITGPAKSLLVVKSLFK
jgi:hypothetical protein